MALFKLLTLCELLAAILRLLALGTLPVTGLRLLTLCKLLTLRELLAAILRLLALGNLPVTGLRLLTLCKLLTLRELLAAILRLRALGSLPVTGLLFFLLCELTVLGLRLLSLCKLTYTALLLFLLILLFCQLLRSVAFRVFANLRCGVGFRAGLRLVFGGGGTECATGQNGENNGSSCLFHDLLLAAIDFLFRWAPGSKQITIGRAFYCFQWLEKIKPEFPNIGNPGLLRAVDLSFNALAKEESIGLELDGRYGCGFRRGLKWRAFFEPHAASKHVAGDPADCRIVGADALVEAAAFHRNPVLGSGQFLL